MNSRAVLWVALLLAPLLLIEGPGAATLRSAVGYPADMAPAVMRLPPSNAARGTPESIRTFNDSRYTQAQPQSRPPGSDKRPQLVCSPRGSVPAVENAPLDRGAVVPGAARIYFF